MFRAASALGHSALLELFCGDRIISRPIVGYIVINIVELFSTIVKQMWSFSSEFLMLSGTGRKNPVLCRESLILSRFAP